MPFINCKIELKLKWANYYVLSAAGADNVNAESNSAIFTIKDTKLYVPVVTLSSRDNQKLSKVLAKFLKDQFIGMKIKQKVRIKIQQIDEPKFFGVNRIFALVHTNQDANAKRFNAGRYYLPKGQKA